MGFPALDLVARHLKALMFQSLVGVYGFSRMADLQQKSTLLIFTKFQSLVGVYGFSRLWAQGVITGAEIVSIPSRGLWVFPRSGCSVQ